MNHLYRIIAKYGWQLPDVIKKPSAARRACEACACEAMNRAAKRRAVKGGNDLSPQSLWRAGA